MQGEQDLARLESSLRDIILGRYNETSSATYRAVSSTFSVMMEIGVPPDPGRRLEAAVDYAVTHLLRVGVYDNPDDYFGKAFGKIARVLDGHDAERSHTSRVMGFMLVGDTDPITEAIIEMDEMGKNSTAAELRHIYNHLGEEGVLTRVDVPAEAAA